MTVTAALCHALVLAALLVTARSGCAADVPLHSSRALVVDEATGQVLLEKNSQDVAPMASLTKLLTAMVVLDARQDPDEYLTIDTDDLDTLKHTRRGVPVGHRYTRRSLLERALLASDNHAASSLARHYPGGLPAFLDAAKHKIDALGLVRTTLAEPTGLSPENRSTASDLVAVVAAAAVYPDIARITSQAQRLEQPHGEADTVRNTNHLVGRKGWDILLSKTGFTNEAGRCLVMRLRSAGRTVLVVLMDAAAGTGRTLDALNVHRLVAGAEPVQTLTPEFGGAPPVKRVAKAGGRGRKRSQTA
jgi:D-alanyl-D-alanine carboxypeptidase/D-alanyl-D-alanine endopeptidase (penicillin-binding protein 7)